MKRRGFIKAISMATAISVLCGITAFAEDKQKPNFIIIFTDDQGYQDLGCFGAPEIKTPNIDQLAAEGIKFTDFYVAAPVCTPSRSALMTGCYPKRVGLAKGVLFAKDSTGLNPNEITLAKLLKTQGYSTACIGKWHLGHHKEFLPTSHGFDSYYGIPYSNDMDVDPNAAVSEKCKWREGMTHEKMQNDKPTRHWVPLMRNEEIIEYPADQNSLTERYTMEAIQFIENNQNKPFFLYIPHTMPHLPIASSEKFTNKSAGGPYGDVIECIDWSTGEIIKTLKQLGLDSKTIVIFTSDNGPWLKRKDGKNVGSALPLRDGKGTTFEGGMREPCVMWAPGRIPAGKICSEMTLSMDIYPTFAKLAGAELPTDRIIDGKDIWPLMTAVADAQTPHEAFFYYNTGGNIEGVRSGSWKLRRTNNTMELYDLHVDISETTNVADKNPEVVKKLSEMMDAFDKDLSATARPVGTI